MRRDIDHSETQADLATLLSRRDELALEVESQRQRVLNLTAELRHLDANILRAGGSGEVDMPINALFTQRLGSGHGELSRLIFDALNSEKNGLNSREIASAVMQALAISGKENATVRYVVSRICVSLWVMEQKGLVERVEPKQFRLVRWRLSPVGIQDRAVFQARLAEGKEPACDPN